MSAPQTNPSRQALVVKLVDRVLEEVQRGMEIEGGARERDTQVCAYVMQHVQHIYV
jgi:hypothetical protein